MVASSKRRQVLEALKARLEDISIANDYETDAGSLIFVNETPDLGPDDPDLAIAMILDDDDPGFEGEHAFIRLPIEFQAVVKVELVDGWIQVEQVLADIKRAIEQEDRTLGRLLRTYMERGPTRTLPRDNGSTVAGVGITYRMPMAEMWGNP